MPTVLLLDQEYGTPSDRFLRGELWRVGSQKLKRVSYPNWPGFLDNVKRGAAAFDKAAKLAEPPIVAVGHSLGAQVLNYWLREYAPDSSIDPATMRFVVTGDPERRYGGVINNPDAPHEAQYGGVGIPLGTIYPYLSFTRQYDYYSDHPTDRSVQVAVWNAQAGFSAVHRAYDDVSLSAASNITYTEPANSKITYRLAPTYPLPILANFNLFFPPSWLASWVPKEAQIQDLIYRDDVEAGYDRPYAVELPDGPPRWQAVRSGYIRHDEQSPFRGM